MNSSDKLRISWLLPVAWFYWHPVLSEFTQLFPQTTVFTGLWPGFAEGFKDSFAVKEVGKMKFLEASQTSTGYGTGFTYLSPRIVGQLLKFKPQVIFADSFRIWTIFALLLKPWGKWRVIIAYEGSSPSVDYRGSAARLSLRRAMVKAADACITNSQAGKNYLTEVLKAEESRVFAMPYEVPDSKSLLGQFDNAEASDPELQRPVFLFVGHLVRRKGLHLLLEACAILQKQGYSDYTLLAVGDGPQREELEVFIRNHDLEERVKLLGRLDYDRLGAYFRKADVFVLPTLEDTWGMVVLEAMLFGKPVLCSKWAGTAEMMIDGENGYVFDPHQPEKLAELMHWFMNNLSRISVMGEQSKQIIANYTPKVVSKSLAEVINYTISR